MIVKKSYIAPEMEVSVFPQTDIIVTSGTGNPEDVNLGGGTISGGIGGGTGSGGLDSYTGNYSPI